MLVLSRRRGEEIVIGGNIRIRLVSCDRGKCRLGITAPENVPVDRAEIHARREQLTAAGQTTTS